MSVPTRGTASIVLIGMSAPEVNGRAELEAAAETTGATIAFLQLGEPTVVGELTRLADLEVDQVTLIGVRLSPTGPAVSWLRRVAGHWLRERRKTDRPTPTVTVAVDLLGSPSELTASDLLEAPTEPITGDEAGLTSPAWAELPPFRHHVLVCQGPRCAARGADRTQEALKAALSDRDPEDPRVLVSRTGCLFPCNHAPVVAVHPDDVWYSGVDAQTITRIVDEHLTHEHPLADHRIDR